MDWQGVGLTPVVVGYMVVVEGGEVGVTQGVPGTSHLGAESLHSSNCPLGPWQSLDFELSHVPSQGERGRFKGQSASGLLICDVHFKITQIETGGHKSTQGVVYCSTIFHS